MKRSKTDYIVIHTAAWPGDPSAEDIRRVHVEENGWLDIGYHFVIRKDGRIEKGRDAMEVGAHCRASNMNSRSIGICCSGHGDQEPFTDAQRQALALLVNTIRETKSIPIRNIIGHREAGAKKTCPGEKVDMDELRSFIESSEQNIELVEYTDSDGIPDFTEGADYEDKDNIRKSEVDIEIPKKKDKNMLQRILTSKIAKGVTSAIGGILGFGGSIYSGIDPEFAVVVAGTAVIAIFMGMDKAARFKEIFAGDLTNNDEDK